MNRMKQAAGVLLATSAIGGALLAGSGIAAADTPPTHSHAATTRIASTAADLPTVVAVAMGQLKETDGTSSTIDLRAGRRAGRVGGTLRFFCPMEGYYNGVVRQLTVRDGAVTVSGAGPLIRPDGTRLLVRYTAELSADGKHVKIDVQGRNGFAYTMEGALSPGIVRAGDPRTLIKTS